jgi:hypothetical protein
MSELQLAKLLFYFNQLENLMREKGAKGESFSDLVKSFDTNHKSLEKYLKFTREFGNKFYYDSEMEYYCVKHDCEEYEKYEDKYNNYKKLIVGHYDYKDTILDGFYVILRDIGHERNQILHDYYYNTEDYDALEDACLKAFNYLQDDIIPEIMPYIEKNQGYNDYDFLKTRKNNTFSTAVVMMLIMMFLYYIYDRIEYKKELICTNYYVNTKSLNIRKDASKFSDKVGTIYKNDQICILKEKGNWALIEDKGWVSKKYLSEKEID